MTIGQTIKQLRLAAGRTQADCATAAGIGQSRWADIEADRHRNPGWRTLARVADVLGVQFQDLFKMGLDLDRSDV